MTKGEISAFIDTISPTGPGGVIKIKKVLRELLKQKKEGESVTVEELEEALLKKQDTLVSGENVKTVGGQSIVGKGNIEVGDKDAIKFVLQQLTEVQKAQARANIDAYKKPSTGIPASDIATGVIPNITGKQDTITDLQEIRSGAAAGATAYQKPSEGVPKSDLESSVQTSLSKANTAIQPAEFNELKEEVGTIGNGVYEEAWDGSSAPVVADIPAGVSVMYNSTSYTGTLAASASTVDKIYLVSDGNGNYDRYTTVEANGAYSWKKVGSTAIPLSNYSTKSEVSQLGQEINGINSEIGKGLAKFDGSDTDIDFKAGATSGKYLEKDTATLKTTESYSVSAPIHLTKGQVLSGHINGNDITILAKTDSAGTSYENILNNKTNTYTDFEYYADEDMYVAVCYRTIATESWLKVATANCTIEDVFEQVQQNKNDLHDIDNDLQNIDIVINGQTETHYTPGGYLKADNTIVEDETAGYSDYIPYQEGNAVLWKFDSQTKSYNLLFYDANKVRISTGWSAQYFSSVQGRLITADSIAQYNPNAAYIRASFTLGYQDASVAIGGVTAWVPETSHEGLIEKTDNLEQRVTDLENAPTPETTPSFVLTEGKATFNRLEEWAGGDSVFLLGQITDVHSGGNDKYKHVGYFDKLGVAYGFNLMVNGGDIGLDVDATSEAVDANNLIFDTKRQMSALNKWVFCKGNHERLEPTMKLGNAFNRGFAAIGNGYIFGNVDLSYGYIDDAISKTRTIFLNSSDAAIGTHYEMTSTQLQWLSGILSDVENDWKVIVVMHFMPNAIGKWNSDSDNIYNNYSFKALRDMLSAFATHTSGSNVSYGLSYDYTNSSASLVCVLAGDSHFNNYVKEDGVNYIVRQGYGYVADAEMPTGATRDSFNYNSQCLFDVLAVKDDGTAKVFRIGAGGSARDLAITY